MGTLTLIRHGQARPFEKESDRLSEIGEEQARALAAYWLREKIGFDEVYSGSLVRQVRTAQIIGDTMIAAGVAWPQLQSTPELNEYDADGLITKLVPALAKRDKAFGELLTAFEQHRTAPDRNRYFQKMFEDLTAVWLSGDLQVDGVEPWAVFFWRVRGALQRIMRAEGSGRRVAVFTSGGVIGLSVQTALNAPGQSALEINWRVRNCSLTEFVFSRDRLSLDSFNAIPHLDDPGLRTFR